MVSALASLVLYLHPPQTLLSENEQLDELLQELYPRQKPLPNTDTSHAGACEWMFDGYLMDVARTCLRSSPQKTAGGILLPKGPPKANSDAHIGEVRRLCKRMSCHSTAWIRLLSLTHTLVTGHTVVARMCVSRSILNAFCGPTDL